MFGQITTILSLFVGSLADSKAGAMKYLIYTGLIALAVLLGMMYCIWHFAGLGGTWVTTFIPWDWAKESVFFSFIIGGGMVVLFWIMMKYIMLMLLSPLLSTVSEKIEKRLTGKLTKSSFSMANSAARSVRINSRNLLKELVITLSLFVVGFIPGINLLAVVAIFMVQSYFAGFGFMDFYLERHFTFRQTVSEVYQHKWAAITLGAIFTILLLIPVLGVVVAPYFSTVTATKYFNNVLDRDSSSMA